MKLMLNGKEVTGMGHYVMAGDIKDATAEDSNVLSGKAYYNNNGKREGTMPNRGGMSAELAAGGSVSIQEGYHNGEGVVRAQDLASQTAGDAGAGNIDSGKTAWVNGAQVTGTSTKVDTSGATATAANIESGYTAWVNGALLTGSMVKGKQVQTGTIQVYSGSFANNSEIATPTLLFKPEGAVFVLLLDDDRDTESASYSYCAVVTSEYQYTVAGYSSGGAVHEEDVEVVFGSNYISIDSNTYKFPKGATMFYVAWGE